MAPSFKWKGPSFPKRKIGVRFAVELPSFWRRGMAYCESRGPSGLRLSQDARSILGPSFIGKDIRLRTVKARVRFPVGLPDQLRHRRSMERTQVSGTCNVSSILTGATMGPWSKMNRASRFYREDASLNLAGLAKFRECSLVGKAADP
jgi:hypothetical protein